MQPFFVFGLRSDGMTTSTRRKKEKVYSSSGPAGQQRSFEFEIDDNVLNNNNNNDDNNNNWSRGKIILPLLRQCLCRLLTGRRTRRTRTHQPRSLAIVLRRIIFGSCFLSLYFTIYYHLEKIENENNYEMATIEQYNKNQQQQQQQQHRSSTTTTTTKKKNVLSHYLSQTTTTMNNNNNNNTQNNAPYANLTTLQEASKGREHILSILKDAGFDTFDPMDVLRLPMWSSVTELYYNNSNDKSSYNTAADAAAAAAAGAGAADGSDDDKDNSDGVPGPIIIGLDTCEEFRKRVKYSDRFLGIAGNFNSGTTAFAITLQNNCHFNDKDSDSNSDHDSSIGNSDNKDNVIGITKDIKSVNRILNQVPWRKHKMAQYRNLYIKNSNNHTENTIINGENVLPIVLIRDPMFWMQSMCKEGYGVRWDHNSKYHCPNLIPNEYDKKRYSSSSSSSSSSNNSSSVQVWMGSNRQVGPTWPSLIHYWNEWYESYLFNNKNTDNKNNNTYKYKEESLSSESLSSSSSSSSSLWPRLIIRFEDTLYYPRQVIEKVCTCGGGTMNTLSKNNNDNTKFIYNINESKPDHNKKIEHNNYITAMIKYGGNDAYSRRIRNMTYDDIQFAIQTLNPRIMKLFQYTYPK